MLLALGTSWGHYKDDKLNKVNLFRNPSTKFILGLHYCSSIPIVRMKHFSSEMNLKYIRKSGIWVQIHVKQMKHMYVPFGCFLCSNEFIMKFKIVVPIKHMSL